jgi:RNA polymerase sigma-70 factor (ECF subfamily)
MIRPVPSDQFVRHLTEHQSQMYAYILALLGDPGAVNDVLQDANVVAWQNADAYAEGTDFGAWAKRLAYYQVLAYRKRCQRDRLVFDAALLDKLAQAAAQQSELIDADLAAMHRCIEKLSPPDQDLLWARYAPEGSVKRLADARGKSVGAISQALYRIRAELADCVERAIDRENRQ